MDFPDSVLKPHASDDFGEPIGSIEPAPFLTRAQEQLEDRGERRLPAEAALGLFGPEPHRGTSALDRVGRAQVVPVLGRKRVEGEPSELGLGQAGDRLVILRP